MKRGKRLIPTRSSTLFLSYILNSSIDIIIAKGLVIKELSSDIHVLATNETSTNSHSIFLLFPYFTSNESQALGLLLLSQVLLLSTQALSCLLVLVSNLRTKTSNVRTFHIQLISTLGVSFCWLRCYESNVCKNIWKWIQIVSAIELEREYTYHI